MTTAPAIAPPIGPLIAVIGVGNEGRSDDAAGLLVARSLRQRLGATGRVAIVERPGEATAIMDAFAGARAAILCDAVSSQAVPGTVHRLDASIAAVPDSFLRCSTHAFGVADAIELARALGRLPPRVVVYGIEGRSFAHGEKISPPCGDAIPVVVSRIMSEIRSLEEELDA